MASIALPATSCTAHGFSADHAVKTALQELRSVTAKETSAEMNFACFSRDMLALHENEFARDPARG